MSRPGLVCSRKEAMAGGATALKVAGSAGSFRPNESRREGNLGSSSQVGEKTGLTGRLGEPRAPTVCPSGRHRTFRRTRNMFGQPSPRDGCLQRDMRMRRLASSMPRSRIESSPGPVGNRGGRVCPTHQVVWRSRSGQRWPKRTAHMSEGTVANIVGASASSRRPRDTGRRNVVCVKE